MPERDPYNDPRRGDLFVAKRGYGVARRVIHVTDTHVETAGMSGNQRNRWMKRDGLRKRYDYVGSYDAR